MNYHPVLTYLYIVDTSIFNIPPCNLVCRTIPIWWQCDKMQSRRNKLLGHFLNFRPVQKGLPARKKLTERDESASHVCLAAKFSHYFASQGSWISDSWCFSPHFIQQKQWLENSKRYQFLMWEWQNCASCPKPQLQSSIREIIWKRQQLSDIWRR